MKNWQIVLWLIVFFPVGIYLMFKHADWSKKTKYIITSVEVLLTVLLIAIGGLFLSLLISALFTFIVGLISAVTSFFRKKEYKTPVSILFVSLILFAVSMPQLQAEQQQRIALEEQVKAEEEAKAEKERLQKQIESATHAVEKAEKEPNRENYKEAYSLVAGLPQEEPALLKRLATVDEQLTVEEKLKEAVRLVELVEKDNSRANYNKAVTAVQSLSEKDAELEERLAAVEKIITVEEEKIEEAKKAVAEAEKTKHKKDYENAHLLVSSLSKPETGLIKQLEAIDEEIKKEETRLAEEAKREEEARLAEEARIAEEARVAEEARIAEEDR